MTAPTRFPQGVSDAVIGSFLELSNAPFNAGPGVGQPLTMFEDFMQSFVPDWPRTNNTGTAEVFLLTRSFPFGTLRYDIDSTQTNTFARLPGAPYSAQIGKNLWFQTRCAVTILNGGVRVGMVAQEASADAIADGIYFNCPEDSADVSIEIRNGSTTTLSQVVGTLVASTFVELAFWLDGSRLKLHVYLDNNEVAVIDLVQATTPFGVNLTGGLAIAEAGADESGMLVDNFNVVQDR
ncbi:MAG: hypothetical protein ACR2PR_11110 [Pseudohongiellaceae bacterium]